MEHVIQVSETGGPQVLRYVPAEPGEPGPGQVLLRQHAIGLNFLDVYYRSGLYPHPLPLVPGVEAAGEVLAVGDGVHDFKPGDRVAYASRVLGSYATARIIAASELVPLADEVTFETAAGVMLQGLTAQYLLRQTYTVKPGDTILFHAVAGGLGLFACQWAKALGATVIGTVSSDEKAAIARQHGCDHAIVYTRDKVVDAVRDITHGEGVPVVYDSVGKDTYEISLDCLRPQGLFVSCGNASGPIPLIDSRDFMKRGSLFFTRPGVFSYTAKRENYLRMAADVFDIVKSGAVQPQINQRYALSQASQAHTDLEARKTTGKTILLPA